MEDIHLLALHFLNKAHSQQRRKLPRERSLQLSQGALDMLTTFPWPGNVRQLEQALLAAAALCEGEEITSANLPAWLHKPGIPGGDEHPSSPSRSHHPDIKIDVGKDHRFLKNGEQTRYLEALNATKYRGTGRWNVSAAARQLGIPRETLAYHLKKLGLFR